MKKIKNETKTGLKKKKMFQLPDEIQARIFSFDPTYREIWSMVSYHFRRCANCGLGTRKPMEMALARSNNIVISYCNYKYCSMDCWVSFSMRTVKDHLFEKAWNLRTFESES